MSGKIVEPGCADCLKECGLYRPATVQVLDQPEKEDSVGYLCEYHYGFRSAKTRSKKRLWPVTRCLHLGGSLCAVLARILGGHPKTLEGWEVDK